MAAYCLDALVSEADRAAAVQRNCKRQSEGKALSDKIAEWKKPSGGKLFACGEVRLGQCILDKVKENKMRAIQKEKEANDKVRAKYRKAVQEAEEVKKKMVTENIQLKKLTNKDLIKLLKPLKRDLDPAIPTKKDKILEWYEERKDRVYCEPEAVELEVVKGKDDDGNQSKNEEDIFFVVEEL